MRKEKPNPISTIAMRAILTPFAMLFSLVIWGQTSQHPFPEFSQETVDQAVLAWEHKRSSVQEEFSVAPRAAMEIAAVLSNRTSEGAWQGRFISLTSSEAAMYSAPAGEVATRD